MSDIDNDDYKPLDIDDEDYERVSCANCEYQMCEPYDKPCNNCMHWVDGYLENTKYKPKGMCK